VHCDIIWRTEEKNAGLSLLYQRLKFDRTDLNADPLPCDFSALRFVSCLHHDTSSLSKSMFETVQEAAATVLSSREFNQLMALSEKRNSSTNDKLPRNLIKYSVLTKTSHSVFLHNSYRN